MQLFNTIGCHPFTTNTGGEGQILKFSCAALPLLMFLHPTVSFELLKSALKELKHDYKQGFSHIHILNQGLSYPHIEKVKTFHENHICMPAKRFFKSVDYNAIGLRNACLKPILAARNC